MYGGGHGRGGEKGAKLLHDAARGSRQRPRVAPRETRAIERTCPCERGDLGEDISPAERRRAKRGVEDNGWAVNALAVQVQPMAADVDQSSGCGGRRM